jgi:Zn-dependent peptidase ImmA (M78 family)/transcriptional regulator with XRE-family HTH domain
VEVILMTGATIDPRILGQRLADARKSRGITQEAASIHLGCSRPTYIAIEKGERTAKPDEIVKLAALFGKRVHELLLQSEPITVLSPHLRGEVERVHPGKAALVREQMARGIEDFQSFLDQYRELERLMNAPLRPKLPDERTLNPLVDPVELAEGVAVEERDRLKVGDQPIINLRSVLESEAGFRIFYSDLLPSQVAGMYDFVPALGCCLYINRKHPPERRRVSMVHEYGHGIVDRHKPGIDYLTLPGRKPANERFADAFAGAFLMPATSVRRRFLDVVNTTGDFQVADLCRMAHAYFVSVTAMAYRLENLGLVPKGRAELLKESRLPVREAKERLRLSPHPVNDDPYPERYKALAVYAYEQEKISEGLLARFLRCDRVTVREIVQDYLTSRDVNEDGQTEAVRFEQTQQSLLRAAT